MVNQSRPFRLHRACAGLARPAGNSTARQRDGPRETWESRPGRHIPAGRAARIDGHKKPGICRVIDPLLTGVVGGTGFEPVTPTMSR